MDAGSDLEAFVDAFSEWVEACWFDERDLTAPRLEAVLGFPGDVVLVGSLGLLDRLVGALATDREEVAAALAQHLIVSGPDPARQALIRDVVLAAAAPAAARAPLLAGHDSRAVTGAALECASFLTQVLAERDGVVPSSIVRDL
ncbi:MAG: hypothetical protein ACRDZ7_19280 [Acidimicrobiia bacterium]